MSRYSVKGMLSCLAILLFGVPALGVEDYRPDLTVDLRQFGYEVPEPKGQFILSAGPHDRVTFLDNETLAVSMFVRNPDPGLSVRGKVFGAYYLFQTVFMDVRSGKLIKSEKWSDAMSQCGLFFAPGGGFVVWHGLELVLHAPDGKIIKTLELDPNRFPRGASLSQSLRGKTLFAENGDISGKYVLSIRTEGLEPIAWFDFKGGYFDATETDSYLAFTRDRPVSHHPSLMDVFVLGLVDQNMRTPVPKPIFTSANGCLFVSFLDEQTLGVSGGCNENDLTILSISSGAVLYERKFGRVIVGKITPCRNCSLLMTGTYFLAGGSAFLDIPRRTKPKNIILFNWKTMNFVEIPSPGTAKRSEATALSPDGCALAIQTDSLLRIYDTCDSALGAKLTSQKRDSSYQ